MRKAEDMKTIKDAKDGTPVEVLDWLKTWCRDAGWRGQTGAAGRERLPGSLEEWLGRHGHVSHDAPRSLQDAPGRIFWAARHAASPPAELPMMPGDQHLIDVERLEPPAPEVQAFNVVLAEFDALTGYRYGSVTDKETLVGRLAGGVTSLQSHSHV